MPFAFRRRSAMLPFLTVSILAALVLLAGCGNNIPVDPIPEKAIAAGVAKEEAAKKAEDAKSAEAAKLWTEANLYWSAVEKKFPGLSTGLDAAMRAARIASEPQKNPYSAWTTLRPIVRRTSGSTLPEQAAAEKLVVELVNKVDKQNSTSPFYTAMDLLVRLFGNSKAVSPVLAITFIALFVTLVLWPLRYKTYRAAKEMQKYAPQIQEIQKKYKDDPLQMQQKMREFQQQHGVNPMGGCLPALAQIPVFLLMIQLINNYQFSFRGATFLWITPALGDLSQMWPAPLKGQIGHHLGEQDLILLVLYAGTMFVEMKLSPPPTDPTQAEQQKMMSTTMPVIYFVMMLQYQLPIAFVLYYFVSNILGVGQQWFIQRQLAAAAEGTTVIIEPGKPAVTVSNPLVTGKKKKK